MGKKKEQEIGNSTLTWAEMTSKYFGQLGQLQTSFLARTPRADVGDTDHLPDHFPSTALHVLFW